MKDEELVAQLTAEITARKDEIVPVEFDLPTCFTLIAVLQFAYRNPALVGLSRATAIDIAQRLAHKIAPPGSALAQTIAMGWEPEHDT